MKRESGITLVALVVTIVVLIILAVISINLIFKDGGLINKAKDAEQIQRQAEENTLKDLNTLMAKINEATGQASQGDEQKEITPESNGQKSEDWIYDETTKTITGYKGADLMTMTEVTIPNTIIVNGEKKPVEIVKGGYYTYSNTNVNDKISSIFNSYSTGYSDVEHRNTTIKKIIIPKGIKEIGLNAFTELYALEEVILPEGLEEIGNGSFSISHYDKNIYLSIQFPNSLKRIGQAAFFGNSFATDIRLSEKIELIDQSAFGYIKIAEGVGFYLNETDKPGCNARLVGIHPDFAPAYNKIVVKGDCITNEGSNFATYNMGTSAETAYFKGLTEISYCFFSGNGNTKEITLENSSTTRLKAIGTFAFSECTGLKKIILPDTITEIGENAFEMCESLENVTLPKNLMKIGANSFKDTVMLNNIIIPASVTTIGSYAFSGYAYNVSGNKIINCEIGAKPSGWDTSWVDNDITVVWNYKK